MKKGKGRFLDTDVWILGALLLMFIYYGFPSILPLEPQGPHIWRQSDGASMAWHFYQSTVNLFQPEIHNQITGDGQTAGEFPIIYWIVGMLYRVFGPHEIIFRTLNLLILFSGLIALGRGLRLLIDDRFWAVALPLLFFTSPVLVFYGSGFMPEPPALGISFWGWYFFLKYREHGLQKDFIWSMVFFCLAMLIKISTAVGFLTVGGLFFLEWNGWAKFGKIDRLIFAAPARKYVWYFVGALGLVAAWYLYGDWYNHHHKVGYFRTTPLPIIYSSLVDFNEVIHKLFTSLGEAAYYPFTHVVVLFCMALVFSARGRKYPFLLGISIFTTLGVFMYFCFFFQLFTVHDYFLMVMLVFPLWIFVHSAYVVKHDFPSLNQSWVFKILVVAFLAVNVYHAHWETRKKYKKPHRENPAYYEPAFQDWLLEIGVQPEDKVISLPDQSPNSTLYLLQRSGWSGYSVRRIPLDIEIFRDLGAKYLIVSGETYVQREDLQPMLTQPLGNYGSVFVYRLE